MARIRASQRDLVLDVGSGHFPHSTADILVDRFVEDVENHRSNKRLVADRPFVCGDLLALPFRDRAFDYVICNQVLEHVDDPGRALEELTRVGRRGYLSVPSEFQEFICPVESHRWVFALKGRTLLVKPKQAVHCHGLEMYGGVFHELYNQRDFRRLAFRRPHLFGVALEWDGPISYRMCAPDEPFYDYHGAADIAALIRATPADDLLEAFKRWLQITFDLSQMYRLTSARARVRRLIKRQADDHQVSPRAVPHEARP